MKHLKLTILLLVVAAVALQADAQTPTVKARVHGLESNPEYMSLLQQEAALQHSNDSINEIVSSARRQFRKDSLNRADNAVKILDMEEVMFDLRDKLGAISNKISIIEQDWILKHLDQEPEDETPVTDSTQTANFVYNDLFGESLQPKDYTELIKAQKNEPTASELAKEYLQRHAKLADLKNRYDAAKTQEEAAALFETFTQTQEQNIETENRLSEVWDSLFDSKSYAYNYLLDKQGKTQLADKFNTALTEAASTVSDAQTPSSVVLNYALQKLALLKYEKAIADEDGLKQAADSLQKAIQGFNVEQFKQMAPLGDIKQRVFISYQDLSVKNPPIYNSRNPIPQCTIYPEGTIYRVLLGTYSSQQSPLSFKGATPLSLQNIYGKYRYFAGAFRTVDAAETAQRQLKSLGFRRPEVVVWVDGQYFNLTETAPSTEQIYKIEVSTKGDWDDALISKLRDNSAKHDIVKINDKFIIPVTGQYIDAKAVADKIAACDERLSVNINKN